VPVKFLRPTQDEFLGVVVEIFFVKRRRVHRVEELVDVPQVQFNVMHAGHLLRQRRGATRPILPPQRRLVQTQRNGRLLRRRAWLISRGCGLTLHRDRGACANVSMASTQRNNDGNCRGHGKTNHRRQ